MYIPLDNIFPQHCELVACHIFFGKGVFWGCFSCLEDFPKKVLKRVFFFVFFYWYISHTDQQHKTERISLQCGIRT